MVLDMSREIKLPVTEEYINFWNQVRIATEKQNDLNCTDEWVLKAGVYRPSIQM